MGKNIEYINILESERKCVGNIITQSCKADCENCKRSIPYNMRELNIALTEAIQALKFQESHFDDYNIGYSRGYNDGYDNCYERLSSKDTDNVEKQGRHLDWPTKSNNGT